jgi:hypothetical protein
VGSLLLQLGRDDALVARAGRVHTLGRDPEVSLPLPDRIVDRRHAELEERDGAWWIRDAGSASGTYVNDERVTGDRRLVVGDVIRIGSGELAVAAEGTCLLDWPGPWSVDRALALARDLAAELMPRHARGLACGALEPGLVVVLDGDQVRLAGLFTSPALRPANPRYLAPELYDAATLATPAADLYSVGRIVSELLPGELPGPVAELVIRLLAPDPAARLASAVDLYDALRAPVTAAPPPGLPAPTEPEVQPVDGFWVTCKDLYDFDTISFGPFPGLAAAFEYCDAHNGRQLALRGRPIPDQVDDPRTIGVWDQAQVTGYDFATRMIHYLRHPDQLPARTEDQIMEAYGAMSAYDWRQRKLTGVRVDRCWCAELVAGRVPSPPRDQLAAWFSRFLTGSGGGSLGSTSPHHGDLYLARCALCGQSYLHLLIENEGFGDSIHHYYAPGDGGPVAETWFEDRPGIHVERGIPTLYRRATVGHLGFDHRLDP